MNIEKNLLQNMQDPESQELEDQSEKDEKEIEVEQENKSEKKTIEIPGIGEIEYSEKTVNFPKHIIEETGGVEGYIRKTISWDELLKFWGINANDWENIKDGNIRTSREELEEVNEKKLSMGRSDLYSDEQIKKCPSRKSIENFKKTKGISMIMQEMTNCEFINQTLNHVVDRGESSQGGSLEKNRMLEQLEVTRHKRAYDIKTNKILSAAEILKRTGLSSDEYEKMIKNKAFKINNAYFQSNYGLNLTNPGFLWSGYSFNEEDASTANSPALNHVILGFKLDTCNTSLRKYCTKIQKIMNEQDIDSDDYNYLLESRTVKYVIIEP